MVAFAIRRTLGTSLVVALATWLPAVASAQAAPSAEEQRRIVAERIEQALAQGGPYSKGLIDPLMSLVELYQESGRHDLAVAATEQAMQVIRANYGLRSLDQASLMRERIRSEEERGNFGEAWDLEQALLTLASANPNDLRSAEIFREIGDKRMDLLRRYRAGEFPPQLVLGCYYLELPDHNCTYGSRRVAMSAMLTDAQRHYAVAITLMLRSGQYSSAELRGLELDLIRSTWWYGGNYQTGRQSLRRLLSYDVASDEPIAGRADALVQMADWDLLYEHRPLALETYQETYDFLRREGVEPAAIDALFSPALPVVLPVFEPNSLATDGGDEHIDVSFEVTRYGFADRIRVLAKTANVSEEAEGQLVRLIARQRFRPRVVDGEFPRSTPVELRYYVSD